MEERSGRKYRSESERRELVERWAASGDGVVEFCHREGVNTSLFYKWRRRVRGVAAGGALEFVELKGPTPVSVSVECRSGRRVLVQGLTLKEVLSAAEGA